VLQALRASTAPLGVAEVAERLGIHPNTARFHLDALVGESAVERYVEKPSGPGRPRTVHTPRQGMDRGGTRSYRLLARILLSQLASTGPGARATATEAGRAWGRYLVDPPPPFRKMTRGEATDRLVSLLTDLGFAPTPGGQASRTGAPPGKAAAGGTEAARENDGGAAASIRLHHCPFLELAEEYDSLVCTMHLGLIQGALETLRAPVSASRLEPFAEPDTCLAHLVPVDAP
jgi:predicted ArsR family transcriptional regulator